MVCEDARLQSGSLKVGKASSLAAFKAAVSLLVSLALALSLTAAPASAFAEQGASCESSMNICAKKGWHKTSKGFCYYKNGKKLRNTWQVIRGRKYHFSKSGVVSTGIRRIGSIYYMFDGAKGLHMKGRKELVKRKGSTYLVSKGGRVLTDWQLYRGKLYHFSAKGKMDRDCKVGRVKLGEDGVAKSSKASRIRMQALKALKKFTNNTMTRSQKLKAIWSYVTSRSKFRYAGKYPSLKTKGWQYDLSSNMLRTRSGNCYGFAATFAALADAIGYKPTLICGRIHGSRDGARDGFTRHCWVRIGGRYYDPELRWAGNTYIYGTRYYPCANKVIKTVRF